MPVYDKFAAYYDKAFAPFEKRFLAKWRKETLAELPHNADILEIGAGTGANFPFYPPCKTAMAGELSFAMLKIAAGKTEENILVQTDAQLLPFADNSFDAAFGTLVFCSIPDPSAAFHELDRVLRPGGKIVLLEHVRPGGILGYLFDAVNVITVPLIEDHFNRKPAQIAEECGLRIIEVRQKAANIVNLIVLQKNNE